MAYNGTMGTSRNQGTANPFYGKTHTPEQRRKISLAHLGKKRPPRSKEWCERISQAKKGTNVGANNPFFGKRHSDKTKEMLSQIQKANPKFSRRAAEHWNWQGGITDTHSKLRNSFRQALAEWRGAVYDRDHYTCQQCGVRGSRKHPLNAHHIKPFIKYPELRFAVDNGITLCEPCHRQEPRSKPFPDQVLRQERQELPERMVNRVKEKEGGI